MCVGFTQPSTICSKDVGILHRTLFKTGMHRQYTAFLRHVEYTAPLQHETVRVQYLRTVDTTIGFVKNVNTISRQVRNTPRHPLSRWKAKTLVDVYNEAKTAYSDKTINCTIVRVCSSRVASLKTAIRLCMVIRGAEDPQNRGIKPKMRTLTIAISATRNHHRNRRISETVRVVGPKTADRPTQVLIDWRPGNGF